MWPNHLSSRDSLEYWKSSPYPLNFMDKYELKNAFEQSVQVRIERFAATCRKQKDCCFHGMISKPIEEIDPGNARLRSLFSGTIGANAWKLLWLPPSLPYYELGWPFADPALKKFTKRLVFSSWRMVPRMIASLTSYEAERNMIGLFDSSIQNTLDSRKKTRASAKICEER